MLIRFPADGSGAPLNLLVSPGPVTLLGLAAFLIPVGFAAGGGWSMIEVIAASLTNIPLPISHSKYRSPLTLPSFFSTIVLQLNSNPLSWGKLCLAYEADGCCPAIVELDCLANCKLRHGQDYDSIGLKDRYLQLQAWC